MYYFLCLNQTQVHQIFHIKGLDLCCISALISRERRDFHYRPAFVFRYWPQNVCCICVLPDLQAATWDNIFPWTMARHQYWRLHKDLVPRVRNSNKKKEKKRKERKCWIANWTKPPVMFQPSVIVCFSTQSQSDRRCSPASPRSPAYWLNQVKAKHTLSSNLSHPQRKERGK